MNDSPLKWPLKRELVAPRPHGAEARIREQVFARLDRRRAPSKHVALGAAVVAAAALLVVWNLFLPGTDDGSGPLQLETGRAFQALQVSPGQPNQRVRFEDGSSLEVHSGSRVEGLGSSGQKMLLLVQSGRADFEVRPGGPRQWIVEAGMLSVEVMGTRFTVERSTEQVSVSVQRGSVLVRSVRLPDGVQLLQASQSLELSRKGGVWSHAIVGEKRVEASKEELVDVTAEQEERAAWGGEPAAVSGAPSQPGPSERDVTALETDTEHPSAPRDRLAEIIASADAARLRGDTQAAIEALEKLNGSASGDPRVESARFALARLYLSRGEARAAERILSALARGSGVLSEEAYLRWTELVRARGDASRASELAAEYLRRYPTGRHHEAMRALHTP